MKRILLLILLTLTVVVPVAAQGDKPLPEVFVSDDESLTLRYPMGWVVEDEGQGQAIVATSSLMFQFNGENIPSGEAAILIVFPTGNDGFPDPEQIYVSGDPAVTLTRLIQTLTKQTTGPSLHFADPEVTTLGGDNAAYAEGSVGDNDAVIIVIDYGDDTFSFMVGVAASGELRKYGPKLMAIAELVNFDPT